MMVNLKSSIRKESQGDYQKKYVSNAKRGVKEKLFLALAVLMLCACSSDDELESSFNGANATGGVTYLTVNLREVGTTTRADDDGYASGTDAERNVANVYFYFYDENGDYITRGNVGETTGTASSSTTGNIEWESNTVVAVYGLQEGGIPTQMLTVVNQPGSFNITNKTLSEAIETLAGTPYADASGNFVMSTSVYGGGTPFASVNCTALTSDNFALEPIDVDGDYGTSGSATPVEVYVERLAAKVGVSLDSSIGFATGTGVSNHNLISIDNLTDVFAEPLPQLQGMNGYYVQIQGWNVDGIARDAYMSKHIDTSWNTTFTWNASGSYRSYWADSPNYGVAHTYPTTNYNSTTGTSNTDATEETAPLDEYLRYVSLSDANTLAFSTGYAYCGENTNTTAILGDATSTGLTNIIVKAQLLAWNPNNVAGTGVDIVKYGGSLYAVEDFCQERVDDVNFTNIIDGAITALPNGEYSESDLTALKEAVANGSVYKALTSTTSPNLTAFGGEMLSLYNAYDGNVTIGYNMDSSTTDNIVYSGLALDGYNFWFSVVGELEEATIAALTTVGLLEQIGSDYYIPLTEQNTMRSYFLSALASDAEATNTQYANSSYPNYYKDGLMYYHVPIEHLGTAGTNGALTEGEYGVVRNHWYDISVTSISSFGHGIAVEDEVIVPISENEIQTNTIGASTKIYSWKEYDQTVIF